MRISVSVVTSDVPVSQDFIPLELFPDMTLEAVKGFIMEEINVPPTSQHFVHNNQPVVNTSMTLEQLGVAEGEVLGLIVRNPQTNRAEQPTSRTGTQRPPTGRGTQPDAETLRLQILGDPRTLQQLRTNAPDLAEAVNDRERFAQLWNGRQQQLLDQQREKEEMLALLDADPFNPDAQEKIAEIIRQERVQENMQKAMEENPESFGRVIMLYIDVLVNNVPIKAFVDSGAQTTIMSPDAAERCGIMRLIDRRFGGIAKGVGTATIFGRVHSADIQIGQYSLASSFTVMEGKDVDLLLGLDMLKRHQMCIDLRDNCLRIQDDKVPFLSENEIPKMMEDILKNEPKVEGPGGIKIGAETGTVEGKAGPSSTPSSSVATVSRPQQAPSGITIHPQGSTGNINTPTRSTARQPPGSVGAFGRSAPVSEQSIAQITELGFSREEAIQALQQAQGNVELAIGLLL